MSFRNLKSKNINKILTTANVVGILFFMIACGGKKTEVIGAIEDRKQMPQLHASEITTIISDSGVTRYRMSAPIWNVYDKAEPSYWEFPEGVHLERFDTDLNVDANIRSQYAKYFDKEELWELRKNVDATNLEGERFETERLYWDQKKEEIYSDTIVKVTQKTGFIYANSFVSDQTLSKYTFDTRKDGHAEIILEEEQK